MVVGEKKKEIGGVGMVEKGEMGIGRMRKE